MKARMQMKCWGLSCLLVGLAAPVALHGQSAPIPVKPGLWETEVSITHVTALPSEVEARIAAMPPAQQTQVRTMMGADAKPVVTTTQVCYAQASMDSLLSQAQQSSRMQCSFTNRVQTAQGASFDLSCAGEVGTATGHVEYHWIDDQHAISTSHMTVAGSSRGMTVNSTVDTTTKGKFVKADCGDVKPFDPPAGAK